MSAPTDEQLLEDHLKGGARSFEKLVGRHTKELYQFLYRLTGSNAVADDIVQEAFLQVHLAASRFDFSRRFKPWLYTIAANKARDFMRSRARRPEMPLDAHMANDGEAGKRFIDLLGSETALPPEELESQETHARVREVVAELPDIFREVIILAYFHGFPYRQIAEVLDIPLGTVKSRLHAAVGTFAEKYRARMGIEQ